MSDAINIDAEPWWPELHWSGPRKEAFILYRDFGPKRTISAVAQKLGKDRTMIGKWSAEDQWVVRCAQYDAYQESMLRAEHEEAIREMSKRHAEGLAAAFTVLAEPAIELARRIKNGELKIDADTDVNQLSQAVSAASRVLPGLVTSERLVRGVSTQNVAVDQRKVDTADVDDYLLGSLDDGTVIADAPDAERPALEAGPSTQGEV